MNVSAQKNARKNNEQVDELAILYSLRNCPYAMRARMAIYKAQYPVFLRDLVLSNKPAEMIAASPKGTVPVIVLANAEVIEESLDVMLWALKENDPQDLMHSSAADEVNIAQEMLALINHFDVGFKSALEQYKCAKRYKEANIVECREACLSFIDDLEQRLVKHDFLMSNNESLVDIALMPFIRQFAKVERQWYLQSPYPKLQAWLNHYLQSTMFSKVMSKHPLWLDSKQQVIFPQL